MEKLMAAIDEYNLALEAWEKHTATFYRAWELDEPITPGERRADEQMYRQEHKIRNRLMDAESAVIAAARELRAARIKK